MKLDDRRSPWRKILDRWLGIPLVLFAAVFRRLFFLDRLGGRSKKTRILLIKLSALGDVVLLLPSLFRLKEEFKDGAEFVFLGGTSNEGFLKLCRSINAVNDVRVFSGPVCRAQFLEKFDLVIDYDQWVRATALIAAATRGGVTCGFRSPGQFRHYAYDATTRFAPESHMAKNFWNLTMTAIARFRSKTAARADTGGARRFESDRDACRAQWRSAFLGPTLRRDLPADLPKKFVLIHPGCGDHGAQREWPVENWQAVVGSLKKDFGLETVVSGLGEREKNLSAKLVEAGAVSIVGRCDLEQLMAVIGRAQAVLVPNTGIMHLADFINDNVVALEGPTNPKMWGPLWKGKELVSRLACAPCLTWGHDYGCSDAVCMKVLTPKELLEGLPC